MRTGRLPRDDRERAGEIGEARFEIEHVVAGEIWMGAGDAGVDDIDHQVEVVLFEQGRAEGVAGGDASLDGVEARQQFQQAGNDGARLAQRERGNEEFPAAQSRHRGVGAIDLRINSHVRPPC